jgi:hypothetical protein
VYATRRERLAYRPYQGFAVAGSDFAHKRLALGERFLDRVVARQVGCQSRPHDNILSGSKRSRKLYHIGATLGADHEAGFGVREDGAVSKLQ